MNQATFVLIGHGSPNASGNIHLSRFSRKLEVFIGQKIYLGALEHFEPDVEEVLDTACREDKTGLIKVMPLFLFAAYHCKKDIPPYIESAQKKFPDKKIQYAPALGLHPLMLEIIHEQIHKINEISKNKNPKETLLLMVGRGTSDSDVIDQFREIGRQVSEKWKFSNPEFAFMAVNKPAIEEALETCRKTRAKRIIVVPYLLFFGVLVEKITKSFLDIQKERPDLEVFVTKVLGNHSNLMKTLLERSKEEADYL